MSPDGDLLFAPSDSLLMSDFNNLTEFDDFHKDLFLSNAMEGIADGDMLEELDCKDDLKLISDANDAFGVSLKGSDDDMDSVKVRDSPFAMFLVDEESSESLQFMDMRSQLDDSPAVSDGIDIKSMGLTHTVDNSSSGSTRQGGLPSYTALSAANKLNCMSLEELELTPVNSTTAMHTLSAPPLNRAVSSATSIAKPTLAPLSPIGKAVVSRSIFKMEAPTLCSADILVTSAIQMNSSSTSSASTTAFGNLVLRGGDGSIVPQLKSALAQSVTINAREGGTVSGTFGSSNVIQAQIQHVPSIQRSQSSHALGQLRIPHCLGPNADDISIPPACKQEVPLSSASGMNIFSAYQSPNLQGVSGRSDGVPMRRVYSTGDLQGFNGVQSFYGMKAENAIPEEVTGVKIGHYTMEERKMKLHRYRQKRTERNFSKKIKYACRKTLADNRPRVRGRFARSDEMGDSSLKGSDLPLIDEYEEVTSYHPRMMVRDQQAFLMANNSCIMPRNSIAQFWNTVGMKVAM